MLDRDNWCALPGLSSGKIGYWLLTKPRPMWIQGTISHEIEMWNLNVVKGKKLMLVRNVLSALFCPHLSLDHINFRKQKETKTCVSVVMRHPKRASLLKRLFSTQFLMSKIVLKYWFLKVLWKYYMVIFSEVCSFCLYWIINSTSLFLELMS